MAVLELRKLFMRPSPYLLVRVLPREALPTYSHVKPSLPAHIPRAEQKTVVDHLLARKAMVESSGLAWPANLRVEKKLEKADWKSVPRSTVKGFYRVLKER